MGPTITTGATAAATALTFNGEYYNDLLYVDPTLTNEELWNIDSKSDDGKPATGKVRVLTVWTSPGINKCTDATDSSSATASYTLNVTGHNCELIFMSAY